MPAQAPSRPTSTPPAGSRPTRGQVTASGVFAEINAALASHQQTFAPKLIPSLAERVKNILPSTGVKIQDPQVLERISAEIAAETVNEAFENLGKIQESTQIPQVLADSLTRSITTHPDINPTLTDAIDEEKIAKKAQREIAPIVKEHQADLEKAAVLKNLDNLSQLPTAARTHEIASEEVQNYVYEHDLPDPANTKEGLVGKVGTFSATYLDNLKANINPQVSTLSQLAEVKTRTYDQSLAQFKTTAPPPAGGLSIDPLIQNFSHLVGFKPITVEHVNKLGVGNAAPKITSFASGSANLANFSLGLAVAANPKGQQQAFSAVLASDPVRLNQSLSKKEEALGKFKSQKSLSYRERKEYRDLTKTVRILKSAKDFSQKQPQKFASYVSKFIRAPMRARLDWTNNSWQTVDAVANNYPGVYVSTPSARRIPLRMPSMFFGGQAARLGSFAKSGSAVVKVGKLAGSEAFAPVLLVKKATEFVGQIGKAAAGYLFGMALYFLALGKAAMTGFLIGAGVGGTVGFVGGALLGLQVAALCGPFAPACAIATVPTFALTGGFVGAAIGGTAGALIALGIASGSATMVSMGVGAGVGGVVGGFVGATVGGTIGAAIGGTIGSVIPFAGTAAGAAIGGAIGTSIGAAVGSIIGAAAGAYAGYLVGHYVLPAFSNIAIGIKNFASGAMGAGSATAGGLGGAIGSALSAIGSVTSSIIGGISGIAGGIAGGFTSVFGALGSLGFGSTATFASIGVFGTVGTVSALTIIGGTITAAAFFNPDPTSTQLVGGENDFFTLTKSAVPSELQNEDLPKTVRFTITLTAKDSNLRSITINDQINVSGRTRTFSKTPSLPESCTPLAEGLNAGDSWGCEFNFEIRNHAPDEIYNDSLLTNTVTIKATPEGANQITDSAVAAIKIGDPPTNCPSGWPTRTGYVTQGPEGGTSHDDPPVAYGDGGLEAIDIGVLHEPVYSTVEGIVIDIWDGGGSEDNRVTVATVCGNLNVVHYWHLLSVDPGLTLNGAINTNDQVGLSGLQGFGYHTHYQFGNYLDRDPEITSYLPKPVPRPCDSQEECHTTIP